MLSSPASTDSDLAVEGGALERLLDRPIEHIRWGLGRTSRMLDALGDPHFAFDVLHIAGTNGKGSVAAVAAATAASHGPVGLYTSPHLARFGERIRIGGAEAPLELLERCAARVQPLATREGATYFEAATVLACLAFAEAGVELAALEVGLGGRLDATNVVRPIACAITSISLDHQETLGPTLKEIAAEKAGILKPSVPVVVGELAEEAMEVIERRAALLGAPLYRLRETGAVDEIRVGRHGTSFRYRGEAWPGGVRFHLPLVGRHQAENAALALTLLEKAGRLPGRGAAVARVAEVDWPGRFEIWEDSACQWVLDVAHNPAGAEALVRTLEELRPSRPIVLVIAMLRRKDWRGCVDALAGIADAWVFTRAPSHDGDAAWDVATAAATVEDHGGGRGGSADVRPDFGEALQRARELAGRGTVVVAGSCHVVGDAREALSAGGAMPVRRGSRGSGP